MRLMSIHRAKSTAPRCVADFLLQTHSSDEWPQEHLRAWLADLQGRDQYVTYRGDEVSIRWHGRPSQCEVAFEDNVRLITTHSKASSHLHSLRSKIYERNYTFRGLRSVHISQLFTVRESDYTGALHFSSKPASSTLSFA